MDESERLVAGLLQPPSRAQLLTHRVLTFFIGLGLAIAEITIGALHLKECPVQPNIPIYLIVFGVTCIILLTITNLEQLCKDESDSDDQISCNCLGIFKQLVQLFLLAWLITGCVWVFSIHKPGFDHSVKNYCDYTVYYFTYYLNIVILSLISLVFLGLCLGLSCAKKA